MKRLTEVDIEMPPKSWTLLGGIFMAGKTKFSLKQKLSAVHAVISGKDHIASAARKLGTTDVSVQRWLQLYKYHGIAGLQPRAGVTYSGEFKLEVIRTVFQKRLSLMQAAMLFGIAQDHTVGIWLRQYEREGAAGLLKSKRGLKKNQMGKKSKANEIITDPDKAKLAALEAELQYLRTENALLKKLKALIQKEQAGQNKRQKPSGN
ncbi:MAG: transposase [Chitinophaga sp.]|uniref:helix-turn-helix domain-containing protein n=1 Tax=Chitinophaga sp. TaxID=1869181 RepID=UPI001B223EBE|nr:helix-turn-helix domain-containing protein [Chitinophaga sp.]MBO9727220.1 transposase [Chitinophaga sp.]